MRLKADFLVHIEQLKQRAANDNRIGDQELILRNLASLVLNVTIAMITRDEGSS